MKIFYYNCSATNQVTVDIFFDTRISLFWSQCSNQILEQSSNVKLKLSLLSKISQMILIQLSKICL